MLYFLIRERRTQVLTVLKPMPIQPMNVQTHLTKKLGNKWVWGCPLTPELIPLIKLLGYLCRRDKTSVDSIKEIMVYTV